MSDIQNEMQQMQMDEASKVSKEFEQQQEQRAQQEQIEMQQLFHNIAQEFAASDPALYLGEDPAGQLGFLIIYRAEEGWKSKQFTILASLDKEQLEITAADGQWEEIHNVMGNWANWTDQKTVYTGSVDVQKIREVLEHQFLSWYEAALKAASH